MTSLLLIVVCGLTCPQMISGRHVAENEVAKALSQAKQDADDLKATLAVVLDRLDQQHAVAEIIHQQNVIDTHVNDRQSEIINKLQEENIFIKEHIANLVEADTKHDGDENQIAFSVGSEFDFGPVTDDTIIPFGLIFSNAGGGWSSSINAFQAPVDGVYQFSASIRSASGLVDNANCVLVRTTPTEHIPLVAMFAGNSGNGVSGDANSVIVELDAGDFVTVQLKSGISIIASYSDRVFSTFSGFLIF